MYRKYIKRWVDFIFSLILSPFVLLICAIVAPFIYFEDKGDVFIKQNAED